MTKRVSWLCALLLTAISAHAAVKGQPTDLNLVGIDKGLVRWMPNPPSHSYPEQFPQPDKMAEFQNLGYATVTLTDSHEINLKADYTVEEVVTNAQLYISQSGVSNGGSNGLWIDSNHQKVEIQEAYVLQPDGTRVAVSPNTLQVSSDNTSYSFNDYFYITVPFPQIKPGSISVLVYKIITDRRKSPLPWARSLYPSGFSQVEKFHLRVNWADDRVKPAWQTDDGKLVCKQEPAGLSCDATAAIPPLLADPDMPPALDILPVLVLAEPTTWADLSTSMEGLVEPSLSTSRKIEDLSESLVKDANTPEDKLGRLLAFVSREIRYVGLEHDRNSVVPKPTETTLEHRFGDCKDKTMLFVDLARRAGLDAYPVLVSSNRQSLAKLLLPAWTYFNHMIACVKLPQGTVTCVDLTDPDTSAEYLPQSLHGAVSLTVGRRTTAAAKLPAEPYTWKVDVTAINRLQGDGTILEMLERRYHSHWAAGLRSSLAAKTKADRDRWMLQDYQATMTDKITPSFILEGLDEPKSPLLITSTAKFANAFNPAQLSSFAEYDPWLIALAKDSRTKNTRYPYAFKGVYYQSELSYHLNPGKTVHNLGSKLDYVTPWGALHRHYTEDGGSVTVYTELAMPRALIASQDISQFNQFLELVGKESRLWFGIQGTEHTP